MTEIHLTVQAHTSWLESPKNILFKKENLSSASLKDDEVLCETLVSAISPGTEIAAYTGKPPLRPGKIYPRLLGYCNVARVLSRGKDATKVNIGDRILSTQSHRSHFIINQNQILAKIPNDMSSEHASCTYLYHLGYDAVIKSNIKYGSYVVIIGLGALGLGAVSIAANAGAKVYVISDQPIPSDLAIKSGARQVFTRQNFRQLTDILGTKLADSVITTTNSWDDWQLSLIVAGRNSIINVLGFPGRDTKSIPSNPLDSQYFYDKQLRIQAVGMAPKELDIRHHLKFNEFDNIKFILEQIHEKRINPDLLISGYFSWKNLEEAYKQLINRENSPMTYLIQWKK